MSGGPDIIKEREELVEFLANLGIEYRYSCYNERNAEGKLNRSTFWRSPPFNYFSILPGCTLLGDFLEIIHKDFVRAAKVYKYACHEFGYWKACNKFGLNCYLGRGTTKSIPMASEYFRKSCLLDPPSPEGCFHAGQMLTGSDPGVATEIKPDLKTAMTFLEKGCEGRSYDACFYASSIYYFGQHGVEINKKKAFEMAKIACDEANHFEACNNLKIMYQKGEGTAKNLEEAKKINQKLDDMLADINKNSGIEFGEGAD